MKKKYTAHPARSWRTLVKMGKIMFGIIAILSFIILFLILYELSYLVWPEGTLGP